MKNFRYFTPTEVIFGENREKSVGKLVKKYGGSRVLIHYGSERVVKSGLMSDVAASLEEYGIEHTELGGVVPNPRLSKVREGIELAKEYNADFILAVGGGSVLDSAKAICYGLGNEGDVWDFYEHTRKPQGFFPLGAILTMSATGSSMSDSSVITSEDGWKKRGVNSDLSRPLFAILNPMLTMTVPAYQTACGVADIMMHTMERYFSKAGSMEITDAIAEALLKTVMKNALILKENPQDSDARAEIMWAETMSHNGLTGCGTDGGDWSCHKIEHEIGGLYDVAHGAGLSAIWGSWARNVYKECPERFEKFAVNVMDVLAVGESGEPSESVIEEGIRRTEEFFETIGVPTGIRGLGVEPTEEELRLMADKAFAANGAPLGSIKKLDADDIYAILRAATDRA